MVSTLSPRDQAFLNRLEQNTGRMNQAALDISSGVKMRQVSDSPDQVSELLQGRAALAASQQVSSNLSRLKTEVDNSEQAIANALQQFDQVQTLGAQGDTATQTAGSRATL